MTKIRRIIESASPDEVWRMKAMGIKIPPLGRQAALDDVTARIQRELALEEDRRPPVRKRSPKKPARTRRIDGRGVVVTCVETGEIFASLTLAGDALNTRPNQIRRSVTTAQAIRGKHFRLANDDERKRIVKFHGGMAVRLNEDHCC
jgi:hypothetical protein